MNRYRNAPGLRAPSRASSSTLCQKCLKRDIYECKGTAQDRPYIPRPSRTQQLLNPKLVPELTNEVPPEDPLRQTGLADEILAKIDANRGRNKLLDGDTNRARSISSHSTNSVATISTTRSASLSPYRGKTEERRSSVSPPPAAKSRKRRHSHSSDSYSASSHSETEQRLNSRDWAEDRNIRRRRRESSPEERGRSRDSGRDTPRQGRDSQDSLDQSKIARDRRSMARSTSHGPARRSNRDKDKQHGYPKSVAKERPGPPRERSLSPYSRRIALTQSMNLGR